MTRIWEYRIVVYSLEWLTIEVVDQQSGVRWEHQLDYYDQMWQIVDEWKLANWTLMTIQKDHLKSNSRCEVWMFRRQSLAMAN